MIMALFKRNLDCSIQPPLDDRIDIEVYKSARKEAVKKAKESTEHLNDLLVENGFTLKIYIAAGGKRKQK